MPEPVRRDLAGQLRPYRDSHPDVRWTRPETWHLTLLFLGSVDPARVAELERLVEAVARQAAPYRIRVDRGGGRIRGADGVAWLGLSQAAGTLIETATAVAEACPPDITEGPQPKRTPSAHLTVVRRADEGVITALREQTHGPLHATWTVDRVELVRSHLERDGARYETLCEATL